MKIAKHSRLLLVVIVTALVIGGVASGYYLYSDFTNDSPDNPAAYQEDNEDSPSPESEAPDNQEQASPDAQPGKPVDEDNEETAESTLTANISSWGQHSAGDPVYVNVVIEGIETASGDCRLSLTRGDLKVSATQKIVSVPPTQTYGCFFEVSRNQLSVGTWQVRVSASSQGQTAVTQQESVNVK